VSQGTTWIVKGSAADDMQSDGSYMQRVGGNNDMQSDGSYMVRAGQNGTMVDDLSSQGSYMVKMGGGNNDGGFTDMQSEGSYMARGFNGQLGNKPIFDDESDGSFIRQSQSSFINPSEATEVKDKISEKSDEEDVTAKFTS